MSKQRKGNKGGLGSSLFNLIYVGIIIGVVLAAMSIMGISDFDSLWGTAKERTSYLVECMPNFSCDFNLIIGDGSSSGNKPITPGDNNSDSSEGPGGSNGGPAEGYPYKLESGTISNDKAKEMLENLKVEPHQTVNYDRAEWKHWDSMKGRSCWTVRKQVLADQAVPGTLKLVDKNKKVTDDVNTACAIGSPIDKNGKPAVSSEDSGEWIDPYSGVVITDASKVDIDHIAPLSYAAKHGGQEWSSEKKNEFANDYRNLLATSAKENRTKGDKGPGEYMPPLKDYRCVYVKSFVDIASYYELSITQADKDEIMKTILTDCTK